MARRRKAFGRGADLGSNIIRFETNEQNLAAATFGKGVENAEEMDDDEDEIDVGELEEIMQDLSMEDEIEDEISESEINRHHAH